MLATAAGFVHTSRFLVELGADPHASDAHGRTPLNLANSATAAEITAATEALELRRLAEGSLLDAAACGNTDAGHGSAAARSGHRLQGLSRQGPRSCVPRCCHIPAR